MKTDMLLTHHNRYGRAVVRPGLPDVFVIQGRPDDYDIAVRIDGGYSDKGMARWVAQSWQELLTDINRLRIENREALRDTYTLL